MPKPQSRKKRFINPRHENTYTFNLVHRSQRDPLAADADAPQHVLLPQDAKAVAALRQRLEEQREFGVFYEDEYDYLQHMKDKTLIEHDWAGAERFILERDQAAPAPTPAGVPAAPAQIQWPGQVFASRTEETVGLLNKAAPVSGPRLDWDPDIVETLDDAYAHESVFTLQDEGQAPGEAEDDDDLTLEAFLGAGAEGDAMAHEAAAGEGGDEDELFSSDFEDDEAQDDVPSLDGRFSFADEETRSRFTQYSMSSSVVKRNEQLTLLDDQFEQFYEAYLEENTGGLNMDEIEGYRGDSSALMQNMVREYRTLKAQERQVPDLKAQVKARLQPEGNSSDEADDEGEDTAEVARDKWDCESILSTYSNIYHRPKLISEPSKRIVISGKTGMPKDALGLGLTQGALKQLDRDTGLLDVETCTLASRVSTLSIRPKHETMEEKRARKKAFQEHKRERRVEKKANQMAFKEEKARQERNMINMRKNIQGQKLT
eukprot:maker-scaffold545_size140784-snap-gene-0.20 protein:Tk11082 transcript:maker-scaffold545_size140784-snap-gene-0.20-mRNA-1 annotation:"ltv1 homolog"